MEKFVEDETSSFYNYLPKGCELCQEGAKLVLFVTGLCQKNCFYCPLSGERRGKDVVFANERPVEKDSDILEEARVMDALGTGITGGEPLLKFERVLHYIRLLKSSFGVGHHIHLYTALAPEKKKLKRLQDAGLDEIRFHPPQESWPTLEQSPYSEAIMTAKALGVNPGIEVPALKGVEKIVSFAEKTGIFLNLNELEFSESNSKALMDLGFSLKSDSSNAAAGSMEYAKTSLCSGGKVHFCSSAYKDAVQLRKRLQRTAKNTARQFDEVTEDGTLVYGIIEGGAQEFVIQILQEAEVPEELFEVRDGKIEMAWWVLEELKEELKEKLEEEIKEQENEGKAERKVCKTRLSIIERYPFENGMLVELIPL